jgi:hypothetical protein
VVFHIISCNFEVCNATFCRVFVTSRSAKRPLSSKYQRWAPNDTGDFQQSRNTNHRDENEDRLFLFPISCLENVCICEYYVVPPPCIEGRCLYRHHLAPYDCWAVSAVAFGVVIMAFNVVHVP